MRKPPLGMWTDYGYLSLAQRNTQGIRICKLNGRVIGRTKKGRTGYRVGKCLTDYRTARRAAEVILKAYLAENPELVPTMPYRRANLTVAA